MKTLGGALPLLVAVTLVAGCDRALLGLPRIAVSALSPDGSRVAYVRNHPTIDGPSQSLWIARRGEKGAMVLRLAEDVDWCDRVVWSSDGSTAAFLVRGSRLILVEATSGNVLWDQWLTAETGSYPPERIVTSLSLERDGQAVHFDECAGHRRITEYPDRDCLRGMMSIKPPPARPMVSDVHIPLR